MSYPKHRPVRLSVCFSVSLLHASYSKIEDPIDAKFDYSMGSVLCFVLEEWEDIPTYAEDVGYFLRVGYQIRTSLNY